MYPIFNLVSEQKSFTIMDYNFKRSRYYKTRIKKIYQEEEVKKQFGAESWSVKTERRPGQHAHTFDAVWVGDGDEPKAIIHPEECMLISDICLLFSIWGKQFVCTGAGVLYLSPTYNGSEFFHHDLLPSYIHKCLSKISRPKLKETKLYKTLFLIREIKRSQDVVSQSMLVSVIIDILSASYCELEFSENELTTIEKIGKTKSS